MCLVFYSLWAIDLKSSGYMQFNRLILFATVPVVYFIMMKYSLNIENENNDGDPIDVFFKDVILILAVVAFLSMIAFAVYIPIDWILF